MPVVLEDSEEHQAALDAALADKGAIELVRKFIGDASCRSVLPCTIFWHFVVLAMYCLSHLHFLLVSSLLVERTGSREDDSAGGEVGEEKEPVAFTITTTVTYTQVIIAYISLLSLFLDL